MPTPEQRPARRRLAPAAVASGVALLLATALGLVFTSPSAPARSGEELNLDSSVAFLQRTQFRDGCFPMRAGGDPDPVAASPWTALALAAAGVNPREQFRPDGHRSVYDCIAQAADQLAVTTDWERTLLVVNAACTDPHDFAGIDLVAKILAQQRPGGAFTREPENAGLSSPVNTTIFAILALAPVREPAVQAAIQAAAGWLLTAQLGDGAWPATAVGTSPDADMTGAALEALHAASALEDDTGRGARDRAVAWLRSIQRDDGGIPAPATAGYGNSASTAWVAQGLWAIGENPGRWIRGTRSMLNFLASLQRSDGAIWWTASDSLNPVWMTSYTLPAYSGRYRPIRCVPYGGRVPDPANARPSQPPPTDTGGTGGGNGGPSGGDGGSVLAGGGGAGAPNFSRPRQGSKGATVGGVRSVRAVRNRRHRSRSQRQQDRDPAAAQTTHDRSAARRTRPSANGSTSSDPAGRAPRPHAGGGATVETGSRARDGGRRGNGGVRGLSGGGNASAGRDGVGGGEQISGVVVGGEGAAGDGDSALTAAYGLRSASSGGDSGPWLATGIVGALLLCAGAGGLSERRRPDLDHFA